MIADANRPGLCARGEPDCQPLFDEYLQSLLTASRPKARRIASSALARSVQVQDVYDTLLWPTVDRLDYLSRTDAIDQADYDLAIRIHRQVCDQVAAHLPAGPAQGKRAVLTCGGSESGELAGQLVVDRLEAEGWEVYFLGGGVPCDEVLQLIGRVRPNVLVIFATRTAELPQVRRLIDTVRSVNACPDMSVLVGGGVFNRADDLPHLIGADDFAPTIRGVLDAVAHRQPALAG